MKNRKFISKLLAVAIAATTITALPLGVGAEETDSSTATWASDKSSVAITPTYDMQLRSDSDSPSAIGGTLEVLYYSTPAPTEEDDNATAKFDYLGIMRFKIPDTPDGKTIKSATLKLVTERVQVVDTVKLYGVTIDNWESENSVKYSDLKDTIASARATDEPIATFTPAGQSGKAITDGGLTTDTYDNISAWTNNIDVTSAITSSSNFDFIISESDYSRTSKRQMCFYTKDFSDTSKYIGGDSSGTQITPDDVIPVLTIEYEDVATEAPQITLPTNGIRYNFQRYEETQWKSNNTSATRANTDGLTFSLSVKKPDDSYTYRMTSESWNISVLSDGNDDANIHPANTWSLYIPFTNNVKVEKVVIRSVDSPQICALITADGYTPENITENTTDSDAVVFSSDNWWRINSIDNNKKIDDNYSTPTHTSVGTNTDGTEIYEDVLELADGGTAVEYAGLLIDNNNNTGVYVTEVEVYGTEVVTTPTITATYATKSGVSKSELTDNGLELVKGNTEVSDLPETMDLTTYTIVVENYSESYGTPELTVDGETLQATVDSTDTRKNYYFGTDGKAYFIYQVYNATNIATAVSLDGIDGTIK